MHEFLSASQQDIATTNRFIAALLSKLMLFLCGLIINWNKLQLKQISIKIETIEPALDIELFMLEAAKVENINSSQNIFGHRTEVWKVKKLLNCPTIL